MAVQYSHEIFAIEAAYVSLSDICGHSSYNHKIIEIVAFSQTGAEYSKQYINSDLQLDQRRWIWIAFIVFSDYFRWIFQNKLSVYHKARWLIHSIIYKFPHFIDLLWRTFRSTMILFPHEQVKPRPFTSCSLLLQQQVQNIISLYGLSPQTDVRWETVVCPSVRICCSNGESSNGGRCLCLPQNVVRFYQRSLFVVIIVPVAWKSNSDDEVASKQYDNN